MRSFSLYFCIFFVLFGLALSQTSTSTPSSTPAPSNNSTINSTAPGNSTTPTKKCWEVDPPCSGKGVCQNDGTCRCYYSYFGLKNSQTGGTGIECPWDVANQAKALVPTVRGYRIYLGVLFGICLILSLYRLLVDLAAGFSSVTASRTLTRYVLVLLTINCLWLFLQCLDYWGNYKVLPIKFYYFIFFAPPTMFVLLFCAIFLHWVELYQRATRSLQKEAMLKKIRPDYEANVSVEDLLVKISFLRRFKYFYLAFAVVALGMFVAVMVVQLTGRNLYGWNIMNLTNQSFFVSLWILFTVGFIVYGVRLMRIMPPTLARKVKVTTYLLCTFSISAMCNSIVKIANGRYQSPTSLYAIFAFAFFDFVCCFSALNIYMPIWQWNEWFNRNFIRSLISGTGTGGSGSGGQSRSGKGTGSGSEENTQSDRAASMSVELDSTSAPASPQPVNDV